MRFDRELALQARGESVLVLDTASGETHSLSPAAAALLERCDGTRDLESVVEIIPAPHRAAAIMGEPSHWRDDTPHNTAGNREGVPVMLTLGGRSQSLTEAYVDGGAGVLHLGAGVRR